MALVPALGGVGVGRVDVHHYVVWASINVSATTALAAREKYEAGTSSSAVELHLLLFAIDATVPRDGADVARSSSCPQPGRAGTAGASPSFVPYRSRSPGWHCRTSHSAASVE